MQNFEKQDFMKISDIFDKPKLNEQNGIYHNQEVL